MVAQNDAPLSTAFTVSVGLSAGAHDGHFRRGALSDHFSSRAFERPRGFCTAGSYFSSGGARGRRVGSDRPYRGRFRFGEAGGAPGGRAARRIGQ